MLDAPALFRRGTRRFQLSCFLLWSRRPLYSCCSRSSQSANCLSPLVHRPKARSHHPHEAKSEEWRLWHHEQETSFVNRNNDRRFDGTHGCTSRTPIHQGHPPTNTTSRNAFLNMVAVENL